MPGKCKYCGAETVLQHVKECWRCWRDRQPTPETKGPRKTLGEIIDEWGA